MSEFKCPICKVDLESQVGTEINPFDGITMGCPNKECPNTAIGHGKKEKDAYAVIVQKCAKSTGKE
jgi:hypothetical protein